MTRALAEHYRTLCVPEFGREWSEVRPGGLAAPWHTTEFDLVAREQAHIEGEAARRAPRPLLICDTDALATTVWHERYLGTSSPSVIALAKAQQPGLYVLTRDDIPFFQDGMRDGEHVRSWMTQRFREVLVGQPAPWIEVSGSHESRVDAAVAAIDTLIATPFVLADPLG